MLVTEQPKDHCVSKRISPNELLLQILSLTINIVSSVAMRARTWTRKQIQCQADRKVCSEKNALHGAEKNLEARKGEAMAEWFGVKRQ